jgi:hypothetical protein
LQPIDRAAAEPSSIPQWSDADDSPAGSDVCEALDSALTWRPAQVERIRRELRAEAPQPEVRWPLLGFSQEAIQQFAAQGDGHLPPCQGNRLADRV